MKSFLLQDWLVARGTGVVTQSERTWLDLSGYRDVVAWLDIRELSATPPALAYQTAPAKDELLFASAATVSLATGLTTTPILQDTATTPLARWFRWQLNFGGVAGDVEFRIWVAANKPGRRGMTTSR